MLRCETVCGAGWCCYLMLGDVRCCLVPTVLTGAPQPVDLNQRDHSGFTLLNLVTSFGHFPQQKKVPLRLTSTAVDPPLLTLTQLSFAVDAHFLLFRFSVDAHLC